MLFPVSRRRSTRNEGNYAAWHSTLSPLGGRSISCASISPSPLILGRFRFSRQSIQGRRSFSFIKVSIRTPLTPYVALSRSSEEDGREIKRKLLRSSYSLRGGWHRTLPPRATLYRRRKCDGCRLNSRLSPSKLMSSWRG